MATLTGVPPQDSRLANAKPQFLIGLDKEHNKFYVQKAALECLSTESTSKSSILTLFGEPKSGLPSVVMSLLNKKERKCSDYPGVYLWDMPLKSYDKQGQNINLFVAEVVGLATFTMQQREKLMLILQLASSGLVFCSQGDVGEHTFEMLSGLVEGLSRVEVYGSNQSLNQLYLSSICPHFLWCLTGRRARLMNSKGDPITSLTYLEETMSQLANSTTSASRETVSSFMKLFRNRNCIELSAFNEKESVSLEAVKSVCLPAVVKQQTELRSGYANGPQLYGQWLASILPTIVEAANDSNAINLQSLFSSTFFFELKAALAASKLAYVEAIKDQFELVQFDPSNEAVENTFKRLRLKAITTLSQAAQMGDLSSNEEDLAAAHLELDEFIEVRERAVRRKQEGLKAM